MNEAMIQNWNSVVKPEDTIYCLGDFSFAGRSVELYSSRLNGSKILVPGNHDPIHPYNKHFKKAVKRGEMEYWKKFYEMHGWKILREIGETLNIPGIGLVNLCHMPYDTVDPRYQNYMAINDGRWLLCGHVHQDWKVKDKMINVGVDIWNFTPIHIDEIAKLILENK
jgi:calcineurin-like phosphoesterase family protein